MTKITIAKVYADLEASLQSLREDPTAVQRAREIVERALRDGRAYYGINTGFGALARERVPDDQLRQLQRNLLLSHSVGVGPPAPRAISALMLALKIHSLGLGYSGISLPAFQRLLLFHERGLVPVVPSRGSVGASGDLAPLAHLCLPLLGLGEFWDESGAARRPAAECLAAAGLGPIELEAKDGLALINGTQLMSAYGCHVLHRAAPLERMADVIAAMSLEALQGSIRPFDARIHALRPHPGQQRVAANFRRLLVQSAILESHRECGKVQDPYSLRCVPQVHGASRDALDYATAAVETEINSVTDNPLVFPDGDIVSGGNFHGQPVAIALDLAAIALAELGSISERRTYLLLEGHDGLPRLLMKSTGVHSGFMVPQYTAAALVSENKLLAHPASVDSIPTCLGQEDHVSMGAIAAVKLLQVLENVEQVLAIELLTAAQALDYRLPLRPGRGVEIAHQLVRSQIPHREADEVFYHDLGKAVDCLRSPGVLETLAQELGPLE